MSFRFCVLNCKVKDSKGRGTKYHFRQIHINLFITCQQENNFLLAIFLKEQVIFGPHSHQPQGDQASLPQVSLSVRNSTSPAALIQLHWLSSDYKGHRQTQTHTECQEQLIEVSSEQEWMKTRHKATTVSASLACRGPLFNEQDTMGLETEHLPSRHKALDSILRTT